MSVVEEMHARHHEALEKESSGWMAAAGAAVGFALHETTNQDWGLALLVIGVAVCVWCGSFAAGIMRSAAHRQTLQQSLLFRTFEGMGATPAQVKPLHDKHEERAKAQVMWRGIQLWSLAAGAGLYLIGAVLVATGKHDDANDRRCLAIQRDMLSATPLRTDGTELFRTLGCKPQGEGSVHAARRGEVRTIDHQPSPAMGMYRDGA